MKKITIILSIILWAIIAWPKTAEPEKIVEEIVVEEKIVYELNHRQEVWMHALEWCESRGNNNAINEVDLDGTPSYYAFQFKPGTFRYYGEMYGVIEKGKTDEEIMNLIKEYELQKAIVTRMILDDGIIWERQFPACVKMLGRPPKK